MRSISRWNIYQVLSIEMSGSTTKSKSKEKIKRKVEKAKVKHCHSERHDFKEEQRSEGSREYFFCEYSFKITMELCF